VSEPEVFAQTDSEEKTETPSAKEVTTEEVKAEELTARRRRYATLSMRDFRPDPAAVDRVLGLTHPRAKDSESS
jgi:hypothetical protein